MSVTPIALTIAGSDSGGGAGIQADLKTFSALEVYGASVITAITAQNTRAVTAVHAVSVDMIAAQISAVLSDLQVNAIKIGMLFSAPIILAVSDGLSGKTIPVVLDPVMIAKSGDPLLQGAAIMAMRSRMLPLSDILTPNLPEAATLLNMAEAQSTKEMIVQGEALLALGPKCVLMKGGHGRGDTCVDVLLSRESEPLTLTAPRIVTNNTHGTGCTLSAAIAAGLARGLHMPDAVIAAHAYLQGAIRAADNLSIGSGHGPVHHFHNMWSAA